MTVPFIKVFKNVTLLNTNPAYLTDDFVINEFQRESNNILSRTIQFEEEAYLSEHPEICAMLRMAIKCAIQSHAQHENMKFLARFLTRPEKELDKDIREMLNIEPGAPYYSGCHKYDIGTKAMMGDLWALNMKHHPVPFPTPYDNLDGGSCTTKSSSFISHITSETTVATPEPSPVRTPTISQVFRDIVSKTVDKATLSRLEDADILYDTAYVEIMKAVENAMEITVVDIKQDITALINTALRLCNVIIDERAKIVAQENWEKRMRKKLKRTLRRADNFRGHETPPTPKSCLSSHESYKIPPPPPCKCHPQFHYNRYKKDRFGIYLPQEETFCSKNVTLTPVMSMTNLREDDQKQKIDIPKLIVPVRRTSLPAEEQAEAAQIEDAKAEETKSDTIDAAKTKKDTSASSSRTANIEKARRRSGERRVSKKAEKEDYYAQQLKRLTFVKKEKLVEILSSADDDDEGAIGVTVINKTRSNHSMKQKVKHEERGSKNGNRRRAFAK